MRPTWSMTPHCSASGMKSEGETMPRSGWFQRSSASAPSMAKCCRSNIGWKYSFELLVGDRFAQLGLGAATRLHARVKLLLVEHVVAAAQLLDPAHRKRGILNQLVGSITVVGADGDAHASSELQPLAAGEERLPDEVDDLPRTCSSVLVLEIADLNDGELVAADTRHGIVVLDDALQPRGDDAQQLVARRIAEHLVDGLEAVEADVLHGDALTGFGHEAHGLADALLQARAVGQTRQRIGERLLVGARSRLLMLQGDGA